MPSVRGRLWRHTVKRVFDRLVAEHEMEGISYATVADYVRWRRPAVRVEEGRGPAQVFIPQAHQPGAEAEVDFGEVWIMLAGVHPRRDLAWPGGGAAPGHRAVGLRDPQAVARLGG